MYICNKLPRRAKVVLFPVSNEIRLIVQTLYVKVWKRTQMKRAEQLLIMLSLYFVQTQRQNWMKFLIVTPDFQYSFALLTVLKLISGLQKRKILNLLFLVRYANFKFIMLKIWDAMFS